MKQVTRLSQSEVFQILMEYVAKKQGLSFNQALQGDVSFDIDTWSGKINYVDVSVYPKK
jgi:hypothetical protein